MRGKATQQFPSILLSDTSMQEGVEMSIFVLDWEMARLAPRALDHGEMVGEIYLLWL